MANSQSSGFMRIRAEALSWFGIAGATLTLVGHVEGILSLAKWVRNALAYWLEILVFFWSHVLFFLPRVPPPDAVFFSFIVFVMINILLSASKEPSESVKRRDIIAITIASAIILFVFFVGYIRGLLDAIFANIGGAGYRALLTSYIIDTLVAVGIDSKSFTIVFLSFCILFILVTIIPVFISYLVVKNAMGRHLNAQVLSKRLWRIVFGMALLLSLNYVVLWFESQRWGSTGALVDHTSGKVLLQLPET